MTYDLVLRSRRTVLPDGEHPAAVAVSGGRIADITGYDAPLRARHDEDHGALPLLPGLVDTHVHVNEPGRTHWEGFATATRAAAAGGVTTIVDMPLNSLPPTVDPRALAVKRDAAHGKVFTDVGFWGGAVPANLGHLEALHRHGVFGFKCFTAHSGVDEFPPLDSTGLRTALAEAARIDALVIVHAEEPTILQAAEESATTPRPRFADFLASRPAAAEVAAVRQVVAAARDTGARAHILHLSAAEALPELRAARRDGVAITAETCPHYLVLDAAEVPDLATGYKCCPPIRGAANREALWSALAEGLIDCVVSDHSPCPPELKEGDFGTAWGGIASIQLGLPLLWTAARERGRSLTDIAAWTSAGPARLVGLSRKGVIAVGNDADLTVFDPDRRWHVRGAELHHRHPVTAYEGRELSGAVTATWLRGRRVDATPHGRLLSKELPMPFTDLPDLAVRGLGGAVLAANDESFAEKECLVRDADPVFTPHDFGNRGQIYDGWETRRRREPGHDWALIRLGVPGVVHGVIVDTAFFKGNYPPEVSVEGCTVPGHPSPSELAEARWFPLVPRSPARGHTENTYEVGEPRHVTHVRLNMHPDGGIARLRVHGEPVPDPALFGRLPLDLAALCNGGGVVAASDSFYSRPRGAIMPGNPRSQADGWETGRRRDDGNDWLIVSLAGRGTVHVAELDTTHLKFNAPGAASLRGFDAESGADLDDAAAWFDLLPRTRLQPDTPHRFGIDRAVPATHVRLDIHPDGGMARLRLFGELTADALRRIRERHAGLSGG